MVVQSWTEVLVASLQQLWIGFVGFLPLLLGALIVFVIGLIVAAGLGALVERVIAAVKLDALLAKAGVDRYFKRGGVAMNTGRFLGRLTYWFVVIAFFLAAADILRFDALSSFLRAVLLYIPQVAVAVLIMLAAVILGGFLRRLVQASVASAKLHSAKFLGTLTYWAVVVFGFLAALSQLGIATPIVNSLVTGFVAMIALAGGIAFGLGGKDYAGHLVDRFRDQTENR
ncbi:MAG: hypothetical protein HYS89_00955 [Candidatus Colwellbacteria bacterium]|nr:hypothetical protein [Candidatus Colwellbacteria bacterium]